MDYNSLGMILQPAPCPANKTPIKSKSFQCKQKDVVGALCQRSCWSSERWHQWLLPCSLMQLGHGTQFIFCSASSHDIFSESPETHADLAVLVIWPLIFIQLWKPYKSPGINDRSPWMYVSKYDLIQVWQIPLCVAFLFISISWIV